MKSRRPAPAITFHMKRSMPSFVPSSSTRRSTASILTSSRPLDSPRKSIMYVSAVLSAHAYIFLVIVCAAFLVAIGWTIHSLFYRDHFADPAPMRAPQISYMRDVRQRELQQLLASNDNTTRRDEENFHDQFIEDCTYSNLQARDAAYFIFSITPMRGPKSLQHCLGCSMGTCADRRPGTSLVDFSRAKVCRVERQMTVLKHAWQA
jgi:hypothetical protein